MVISSEWLQLVSLELEQELVVLKQLSLELLLMYVDHINWLDDPGLFENDRKYYNMIFHLQNFNYHNKNNWRTIHIIHYSKLVRDKHQIWTISRSLNCLMSYIAPRYSYSVLALYLFTIRVFTIYVMWKDYIWKLLKQTAKSLTSTIASSYNNYE